MPFIYETLSHGGTETLKTAMPPFSFGIAASNYAAFGDNPLGIAFAAHFLYPRAFLHSVKGTESRYGINDVTAFDMYLGIGYRLFEQGRLKIPLTAGLHLFSLSGSSADNAFVSHDLEKVSFGLGASIAVEFHAVPIVYFFGRLQGYFDFFTYTKRTEYTGVMIGSKMAYYIDSNEYTRLSAHVGLIPELGVGLKFDGFFK
jgi:hypothetical protein